MSVNLTLSTRRIRRALLSGVVFMTVASVAAQVARRNPALEHLHPALALFKLSAEHTIPAFFSAVMLLVAAALLGVIALAARDRGESFVRHRAALAVIFLYLSIDEAVGIHELAIDPLRTALRTEGFLHYAWVIPGTAAVLLLGAVYYRFVMQLRPALRRQVIFSGVPLRRRRAGTRDDQRENRRRQRHGECSVRADEPS